MVHHQVYKSRDFMRKSNLERVTSGKFEKKFSETQRNIDRGYRNFRLKTFEEG